MKKFGFTLAEILLSMTIIGIVAALTAPTLINMMPNREKAMTLKYRKLITEMNVELLNNRSYYVNGEFDNKPSLDTDLRLLNEKEKSYLDKNKYAFLLMKNLESYNDEGWGYDNENNPPKIYPNEATFTTKDGFQWNIIMNGGNSGVPKAIWIDMNGAGDPNSYGSSGTTNPDRFYFKIKEGYAQCDEKIDPITCRYLKCPYYMNNKKHDYECIDNYKGDCACEEG